MSSSRLLSIPLLGFLLGSQAVAQTTPGLPTHCASDEFAYLNATMGHISHDAKGQMVLTKNGKVLSLCADRANEPYGKFTYRYGAVGNVELERSASVKNKFSTYGRSTSPRTGENIFFFSIGINTYYVTEATGQGNGVSLYVFKSGKPLAYLFSGTVLGTDFELGPAAASAGSAGSPVFRIQQPPDHF